jgi:hypothetical protein
MGVVNLDQYNWYGFDHAAAIRRFAATRYVGTFCVKDEYKPVAVYYSENPDTSLGHKNYILLHTEGRRVWVRGMTSEEIEPFRYQAALRCNKCQEIVYSTMRHEFKYCGCQSCFIDGGRDYTRSGGDSTPGLIDLIENSFIPDAK